MNNHVSLTSLFHNTVATLNNHWKKLLAVVVGNVLISLVLKNASSFDPRFSLVVSLVGFVCILLYAVFLYSFFLQTVDRGTYVFSWLEFRSSLQSFLLFCVIWMAVSILFLSPLLGIIVALKFIAIPVVKNLVIVLCSALSLFLMYRAMPYAILSIPALIDRKKGIKDAVATSHTYVMAHGKLFLKLLACLFIYSLVLVFAVSLFAKLMQISVVEAMAANNFSSFANLFIIIVGPLLNLFWFTFYAHVYIDIKRARVTHS